MNSDQKLDQVLLLLLAGIVFFTLAVFAAEHWYPMDGQLFQVMSNLLSGFGGALLMRIKPKDPVKDDPPASASTVSTDSTISAVSFTDKTNG